MAFFGSIFSGICAVVMLFLSILCFTTGGPVGIGIQIMVCAAICGACSIYMAGVDQ